MTTRLDKPLKREVVIEGAPYTLTVTSAGFKLVRKGRRKGLELAWCAVVSGDAALAAALNASLGAMERGAEARAPKRDGAPKLPPTPKRKPTGPNLTRFNK
jgi:hypothetical protein